MQSITRLILMLAAALFVGIFEGSPAESGPRVSVIRTPEQGIQPQAAVDSKGRLHLIYFKGDPAAGDIFYVRRDQGGDSFTSPLRVNSQPGSVIAVGTVRGGHIALGRGDRIHVAWMGSKTAEPRGPLDSAPMLYARLNDEGKAFEPQRNLLQFAAGLDGGGSVAADGRGNVYVAWHAGAEMQGEANRRVWIARSNDDGKTFTREVAANDQPTGACGCCGMRAAADDSVYMLYRTASAGVNRDMFLLVSKAGGGSFQGTRLHNWRINACPMSTASISPGGRRVMLGWETEGQVYYATFDTATGNVGPAVSPPGGTGRRKHPAMAANARGETILVWTEGTGWQRGGSVAWQLFDDAARPVGGRGELPGVPVWSLATVAPRPDDGFVVVF
jgi:hypothetical protein